MAVIHNHDIMTSFWLYISDPEPQNLSQVSRVDNCVRLLLYAYGQQINVLKHFVYV